MEYLPIFVAALMPMVMGFIWYNPKTFEPAWMASIGMTKEQQAKGNMPLIFGLAFAMALVISYKLSGGAGYHEADEQTFMHGAFHGGMNALMYVAPVLVTKSLFEQRSFTLILIDVGYWVITFALMSGILYAMHPMFAAATTG